MTKAKQPAYAAALAAKAEEEREAVEAATQDFAAKAKAALELHEEEGRLAARLSEIRLEKVPALQDAGAALAAAKQDIEGFREEGALVTAKGANALNRVERLIERLQATPKPGAGRRAIQGNPGNAAAMEAVVAQAAAITKQVKEKAAAARGEGEATAKA